MKWNTDKNSIENRISKQGEMQEWLRTYEAIFNYSRVGLAIGAADTKTLDLINPYFAKMHGYSVEELTGRPVADVFAPEYRSGLPGITALIHEVGYHSYEAMHIRKDGSVFPVLINAYTVYNDRNEAQYRIVNVIDLTELKKNEQRIHQLYNQANTLVRTALTINAGLDLGEVLKTICLEVSTLLKASCATVRLLEQTRQTFKLSFTLGVKKELVAEAIPMPLFNQYFGGAEQVSVIPDLMAVSDSTFVQLFEPLDLRTIVAIKLYNAQEITGVIMLFRHGQVWDVTEEEIMLMQGLASQASLAIRNARLYQEIKDNREKLQELHHQLLQTQEVERRRISRELHDEIGQALTALKIKLELLADTSCDNCRSRSELDQVIFLVDETLEKTRHIAYDLRPPGLETVGLKAVLNDYCRTFSRRVGIPIFFYSTEDERPEISDEAAISLYRVLQEALTNAAKHSKASRIIVRLQTDEEFLSLVIQDNGVGFNTGGGVQDTLAGGGIGIMGMKERLALLGGRLTLKFCSGEGLHLSAQVPWERLK